MKEKNTSKEVILELIRNSSTFLIMTHKRPDGDAISSALAMFWYLLDIGKNEKNIDIVIPEYAKELAFISGIEYVKKQPAMENYDLAILVDCAELRMLEGKEYMELADKTICIDHHEKEKFYANYNVVKADVSSCTTIIFDIFRCVVPNYLNCIATGLISDTSFLTLNVNPEAKDIIKKLRELGVDIDEISKKLATKSNRTEELTNLVIKRGKFINGNIFCSYILQSDLLEDEKNLTNVNHKLIIQELQKEVEFETLILFIENEAGEFKGSMRTFSDIDLNTICSELLADGKILKGGGHSYSAGCTVVGSYEDIFKTISDAIIRKKQ